MYQSSYRNTVKTGRQTVSAPMHSYHKRTVIKTRRQRLPIKRIIALFICLFLLFCVLRYSFDSFIYDIFSPKAERHLNINYYKLMHPASSLIPELNSNRSFFSEASPHYDNPLMINIPEKTERTKLKNALLELAQDYKKIHPAVYVFEYSGKSYVNINADEPFPAASIIKVPVLIELFRNIEKDKFSLDDTMVFEEYFRAGGSGRLKYSEEGRVHTLDYLAKIMIENSDNSSTNMLISKIGGMPEVNKAVKSWGLKHTRINNWLPDLEGTNTVSARELAEMFYNLDVTNIVSNESKKYIADYLGNVKNTRLLKAGLPPEAKILHKTGDIGHMLGDAGIIKTADGRKYITVILARRPYNSLQGKEFIVKASNLIYKNIEM